MRVYLDNAASTPVAKEVVEAMLPYLTEKFANPSSLHTPAQEAREAVEQAREIIARKVNTFPNQVIFTSGGTESVNFAIKGVAFANMNKGKHIITSKIEHECVLQTCEWLKKRFGFKITYLDVDKDGFVNLEDLKAAIRKDTILVSIMHANNEIGTIEPIEEIGKICRDHGVIFHTDACQSFTKVPIDIKKFNIDLLTINAHKIHGPKGIGALILSDRVKIDPLLHGGGHECGLRSGTENVPGIVGFAKAVEIMKEDRIEKMKKLRDILIDGILGIDDVRLNGPREKRLCNNTNFSFRGIEGESLVLRLDSRGIAASTGSACSSHKLKSSHVLLAIGLSPEETHGSIRFSLGIQNTKEEIKYTIDIVKEETEKLRELSPIR